tara:strand:- start:918 stop:1781 length:864 start_codon:yes stop_codon:yes gene_type:complete
MVGHSVNSRGALINYAKRRLGAPVLEINVADEQVEDLLDDAIQFFQQRHFDGVERMYLKHRFTQDEIDRGKANQGASSTTTTGIVTTTGVSTSITGYGTTTSVFTENSNFIQVPDAVIGIQQIFKFDSSSISGGMFSIKYQLFLNDLYYFNSVELLQYSMVKSYLEDIDFLLTPERQIRFNKQQNRLYIDINYDSLKEGDFIVIDCLRVLDPNQYQDIYNDMFLKMYFTALLKRQWGQNLIKFRGTKLPGGLELNGREIYEDGMRDVEFALQKLKEEYELPPLDFIG